MKSHFAIAPIPLVVINCFLSVSATCILLAATLTDESLWCIYWSEGILSKSHYRIPEFPRLHLGEWDFLRSCVINVFDCIFRNKIDWSIKLIPALHTLMQRKGRTINVGRSIFGNSMQCQLSNNCVKILLTSQATPNRILTEAAYSLRLPGWSLLGFLIYPSGLCTEHFVLGINQCIINDFNSNQCRLLF